jgi:hypothetical protein
MKTQDEDSKEQLTFSIAISGEEWQVLAWQAIENLEGAVHMSARMP